MMEHSFTKEEVLRLAEQWEPEASKSPMAFRQSKCVKCAKPMAFMWHIWLSEGGFKKEVHLCRECGKKYNLDPSKEYVL